MLKLSTLAACALALSGGMALAQAGPGGTLPPVPDNGPRKAPAGAPMARDDARIARSPGSPSYTNQAQGQAQGPMRSLTTGDRDNPGTVAITDEYGNRYNSRGERIQGRAGR